MMFLTYEYCKQNTAQSYWRCLAESVTSSHTRPRGMFYTVSYSFLLYWQLGLLSDWTYLGMPSSLYDFSRYDWQTTEASKLENVYFVIHIRAKFLASCRVNSVWPSWDRFDISEHCIICKFQCITYRSLRSDSTRTSSVCMWNSADLSIHDADNRRSTDGATIK